MKKYIIPWLTLIIISSLFGWAIASDTTWWGGIIAFFCMILFLLLVIAGGDMLNAKIVDEDIDEVEQLCDRLRRRR